MRPGAAEMTDEKTLRERYEPTEIARFAAEPQIFGARFSPCGKFLASGSFLGQVRRWDAQIELPPADPESNSNKKKRNKPQPVEVKELSELEGHGGWVQGLAFSPRGDWLFSADSWGKICGWPYAEENPQPKWTLEAAHDGWIQALAVSPDGNRLASCGIDRKVRVWSTDDGSKQWESDAHVDAVLAVCFHPSGEFLLSGDLRGVVRQWDVSTGRQIREIDATPLYTYRRLQDTGGVRCMAFNADGTTLACGGTQPKTQGNVTGIPTLLLFDFKTGKLTETMEFGTTKDVYVSDVHLHAEGFVMVVTSGTPGTGKFLYQQPGQKEPFFLSTSVRNVHALSLAPDGRRVAITGTNNGSNGNGRRLDKDGRYVGNNSPVHVYQMPAATT